MKPILYSRGETIFANNGLGRLADCVSCTVTEERNGIYECVFTYPISGEMYSKIQIGCILGVIHDDAKDIQPFDIYAKGAPMNGLVTFYAHHVSYRLGNIILRPFSVSSITAAFAAIPTHTYNACPFTFWTDKSVTGNWKVEVPSVVKAMLGGSVGSILDVYGKGEYEWDKFTVKLRLNRGNDNGVSIRYGVNLTDINQDLDISGVYNAVAPFWKSEDNVVTLTEGYVAASSVQPGEEIIPVPMDLSGSFQEQPTEEQLRAEALRVLNNSEAWIPNENITVKFIDLAHTEEYKDVAALQRVRLCDKVSVYCGPLGIQAVKMQVIKVVYNVLTESYDEIELGKAKTSFSDMLTAKFEQAVHDLPTTSAIQYLLQQAIENATNHITGAQNSHIRFIYDANDNMTEIVVMDTDSIATATKVWRWNSGGLGYSSNGYAGPYALAMTQDGAIVADFITSGTLTAGLIRAGILQDALGNNFWNLETGEFQLSASTTVGGSTVASIAEGKASDAESRAKSAAQGYANTAEANAKSSAQGYANTAQANAIASTTTLDNALNQQGVFNRLTNNGQTQGIYLKNGLLYINATYMDTGTLNANLITAGGIDGTKIADGGISAAKIVAGAVTADKIASGAITADKIAAGAITTAKLSAGAITADTISAGAVSAVKIADGAITAAKIAAGAITASMITAGTMAADRISGGTLTLGGNGNGNGTITVLNAAGAVIGTINQNGLSMQGALKTTTDSNGVYSTLESGSLTYWKSDSNGTRSLGFVDYYAGRLQIRGVAATIISGDNAFLLFNNTTAALTGSLTVSQNETVSGTLTVSGTKSRNVSTEQYSDRLLYCYETPSPMFGDIGEGVIGEDGKCFVWLDPVFAQTITTYQYQVFLQKYGEGDLYVSERRGGCFVVAGTPNLAFGWEIKARQKDFDQKRLDRNEAYPDISTTDYGESAAQYIEDLQKGRIST